MTVEELVNPSQAALLVVDMQNDFCHSSGAAAAHGADVSMIQAMAPRLAHLLDVARQVRLPIVHVRTHHSPWTDSASWVGRHRSGPYQICLPGSWGADYYEGFQPRETGNWQPRSHEYVVTKHRYSAFLDTDLDLALRSQGIRTVIMSGEATNVCVESTARDGYMKDYHVAFLADCTAATVSEAHEATLYTMGKHFGTVLAADQVIAAWQSLGLLKEAVSI